MNGVEAVLVRCDDAAVPSVGGPWDRELELTTRGPKPSVNLKIESMKRKVIGKISPRVDDLIRIAAFIYAADLGISRGGLADVHLDNWKRDFTLCIPVNDLIFWSNPTVRTALVEALETATDDWWAFHFTQDGLHQSTLALDSSLTEATPDCVVLFSGGTDSLCATLQALLDQGRKPLLVSHRSAGHHAHRHITLIDELDRRIEDWGFPHISFWIQNQSGRDGHETQRSRAFLYAALGAAVAGQARLSDVLLADNGYVSINPPISGQVVGAVASRGTHPTFLRLVNRLLALVFAGGVIVRNPLEDQTRAEALGVLTRYNLGALLPLTRSCGKSLREKGHPHCGTCSQCVDRRVAVLHAGLADWDTSTSYSADCFTSPIPPGRDRTLIRSYAEFALTCDRLGPEELFFEVTELSGAIDGTQIGAAAEAERIARLLVRHSFEVLTVMGEQLVIHRDALLRGLIDSESLLGAWPGFSQHQSVVPVPGLAVGGTTQHIPASRGGASRTQAIGETQHRAPSQLHANRNDHANEDRIHIIQRIGKTWVIAFGDESGNVAESVGWRRLMVLLQHPGQEVKATQLIAGTSAKGQKAKPQAVMNEDGDPDDDEGFEEFAAISNPEVVREEDSIHVDDILDPKMIQELKQRVEDIPFELAAAKSAGNQNRWLELNHEYEACKSQLRRHLNLRQKSRRFDSAEEQARSTVSKTVNPLIESLALHMPLLHQHLKRFVHLGFECIYDPHPREHWQVAS